MNANSIRLEELLRLSFPGPITWLAPVGPESRPIHWVSDSIEDARADDILLASGSGLEPDIFRTASEKQVAAVVLLGEPVQPELPPSGLPVAVVVRPTEDLRAAQRSLLTNLLNLRAALLERGIRIHNQLARLQAEGGGLEGLAKALAEISGRAVLIQDKRGHIQAEYCNSALLTIWKVVLEQLAGTEHLPATLVDRKRAGQQRPILTQELPGGLARLVSPIAVGEVARGYLSLVGIQGEFDELDSLTIEQGVSVCAIEMARSKAVREAEKRLKGDLLTALLKDTFSPREAALWVETMGLVPDQAHVAIRFSWDGSSPPSRRRLETLVNGEIARKKSQAIISPIGSEIVCFCQETPGSIRPDRSLELGKAVLTQAGQEYPQTSVRCGIGTIANSLDEWRISMQHAGQALEMARRLGEMKPLYYTDLSVYRLLLQLEHSPELIAFQEETIGPLLAHEGFEELIQTLEAYFENHGNLSQAAEALFIHRNTLVYRMERIARIIELDLTKGENRLALQLALRIYRMKKHYPNPPVPAE